MTKKACVIIASCPLCAFVLVILVLGRSEGESAGVGEIQKQEVLEAEELSIKEPVYANDIDRLNQLVDRLNAVLKHGYAVVFGPEGDVAAPLITVDYSMFDRLSDDGAAVMVAEVMISKSSMRRMREPQVRRSQTIAGMQVNDVLQVDEAVGRYLARAGFSSDGFTEWLGARRMLLVRPGENSPPDSARIEAFTRGFLSQVSAEKSK